MDTATVRSPFPIEAPRPAPQDDGGRVGATRSTIKLFTLVDCSASMHGEKIEIVNRTMQEVASEVRELELTNPGESRVELGVARFGVGASWHLPPGTDAADFTWDRPVEAKDSHTDLGAGYRLVAEELTLERMGRRNKKPVIIAITDGEANDDWEAGLAVLNASDWGKRAAHQIRIAIGIGANWNKAPLEAFIAGAREGRVVTVTQRQHLREVIQWATVRLSQQLSRQKSVPTDPTGPGPLLIAPPPTPDGPDDF